MAEAHDLPNLVAIAGPNGAGKSSLLDSLRSNRQGLAEPGTVVLFMGPHRTWRSSQANMVTVYGYQSQSFSDVLSLDSLPSSPYGMGNLQFLANMFRDSSSADDSQAFVKTSLIRLHNRQQALVTRAFQDQSGSVAAGSVPQLFDPLIRLVDTLLPHLQWLRVDDSDTNDIRCIFARRDQPSVEFDIDALSSGEKAAISMFLPFVERQADQLVTGVSAAPGVVPITMILDEPEIHLHPSLQLQVLQYLRDLSGEGSAQFIISTHSPTLLDAFDDDELWLLSPASLRPDNQLSRLSTSHERLEVARAITGATHLLTRSKPIVIMEGVPSRSSSAGDVRLTKLMLPDVRSWSLIPSGGKSEVARSVERLRGSDLDVPGLPVFGLVDGDHGSDPSDDHVIEWPVAMIENLLLDGGAIFAVLSSLPAGPGSHTPESIDADIDRIALSRRDKEIELRVRSDLPVGYLRFDLALSGDLANMAKVQADEWIARVGAKDPVQLRTQAEESVDRIIAAQDHVQRFHGKEILKELFDGLAVASVGLGVFSSLVAAQSSGSNRIETLTSPAISRIRLYIPDLAPILEGLDVATHLETERQDLVAITRQARAEWSAGAPVVTGRIELRERLFSLARELDPSPRETLAALASEVGTD